MLYVTDMQGLRLMYLVEAWASRHSEISSLRSIIPPKPAFIRTTDIDINFKVPKHKRVKMQEGWDWVWVLVLLHSRHSIVDIMLFKHIQYSHLQFLKFILHFIVYHDFSSATDHFRRASRIDLINARFNASMSVDYQHTEQCILHNWVIFNMASQYSFH